MIDKPLRFCMITTFYPPYSFGGDGAFVHYLSNELARRGHHVDVIHCVDSYRLLAGGEPPNSYCDHPNVKVHGLKSALGFMSPLATQQTGYPLLKTAKIKRILEADFDVIHFHNITLVGGPKILEYGSGIKLYTMHDYWLVCPTHVLFKFNSRPCTKKNCFLCSLSYSRPPQLWRYFGLGKNSIKNVNALISPGRFTRDKLSDMGLSVPTEILQPFVPEEIFTSSEPGKSNCNEFNEPYFLFVGRLEKLKGLQTLIPIFRNFNKVKLLVAGSGSYESVLRKIASDSENIQFLGAISKERLRSLYKNAEALIVPSLCYEIFPLVIIEAFTQKTPVIVRNIGGLPEIVEESGGGIVYNTDEELIESINLLLAKPEYRDELGTHGYNAYIKKWTSNVHLENYFSLIGKHFNKNIN